MIRTLTLADHHHELVLLCLRALLLTCPLITFHDWHHQLAYPHRQKPHHIHNTSLNSAINSAAVSRADISPDTSENDEDKTVHTEPSLGFDPRELPEAVRDALNFLDLRFPTGSEQKSSDYCKLFRHMLSQKGVPPDMTDLIPQDHQQMESLTESLLVDMVSIDACPKDHLLYRGKHAHEVTCPFMLTEDTRCNEPRYKTNSTVARRTGYYTPLQAWLSAVFSVPLFRQALVDQNYLEGKDADELRDVFTGRVYQDFLESLKSASIAPEKVACFIMCHDKVEITRWPQQNMCAILLACLNFVPWIRCRRDFLFPCCVLPKNCKNLQVFFFVPCVVF